MHACAAQLLEPDAVVEATWELALNLLGGQRVAHLEEGRHAQLRLLLPHAVIVRVHVSPLRGRGQRRVRRGHGGRARRQHVLGLLQQLA